MTTWVLLLAGPPARAAPDADLWDIWLAHDPSSAIAVDHGPWDALLRAHHRTGADGIARIDYSAMGGAARAALDAYITTLAATPISRCQRPEQFAYWINLYNALTVAVILDHYPVETIRDIDISPGLFSVGPWGRPLVTVEGHDLSLDDIEHRILRPIWRDPRIHYAVNCAALGCPDLAPRAYRAETISAMLDEAARAYVNHPRGVEVTDRGLVLSKIYDWYRTDFGADEAALIDHLRAHAAPALAERLVGEPRVRRYRYDWRLNDAAAPDG